MIGAAAIAALGYAKYIKISAAIAQASQRTQPPEAVTSAKVTAEVWPVTYAAIGTLAPVQGAVLSTEELGRVSRIAFESGDMVQAGQILVELDTTVEEAQLRGAAAQLDLARISEKRERALRERNANSPAELDAALASLRNSEAEVARLRAIIARKKIAAPFPGRTGIRLVNIGQVVMPGTPIVSLQSLDRLYVNFSLAQQVVGKLHPGSRVEVSVDAYPQAVFQGTLSTVQPEIEQETRTVKIQATVNNSAEQLRPGMFAKVSVILPESEDVLQIPTSSVHYAPYGDGVYVLETMKDPKGKEFLGVRRQIVKLGRHRGDLISVLSGLRAGEEVVSSGVFKLRPNSPVLVNNSIAPGSNVQPDPEDT